MLRSLLTALFLGIVAASAEAQDATLPSDVLFDSEVVNRLDLRVHSADWDRLKQNFTENTYYPADLLFNGHTVRNAAIRSRGSGSRSGAKPGLRVDFDRYVSGQRFLGLESLVLDNLTQDPSTVHETVTMKLFARLGIPAPREAHVILFVNNEYVGLYAVIESIDKDFLARIFGSNGDDVQNDGYLYEFNYVEPWRFTYLGPELEAYEPWFEPETRDDESDAALYGPIETLVQLVNELPPEDFPSRLLEHLDLRAFVRFVAAQNFVAQNDGFLGYEGMNNFYLYRLENSSRHVLIAWDEDLGYWAPDFDIHARHAENVLMAKAMQVEELREEYYRVLREAIDIAEEPDGPDGVGWLEAEMRRQLDLVFEALVADPVKPYTMDDHVHARNQMIIFSRERTRHVREQLDAARGSQR